MELREAHETEVRGEWWSLLGYAVDCSEERVGGFDTAVTAGGPEADDEGGSLGWGVLWPGDHTGDWYVEEADLIVRGSDNLDTLGYRVVFPGDVNGDGDGEWLVTGITSRRPDDAGGLHGGAWLYDAAQPGLAGLEDATTWIRGDSGASMGAAQRVGDLNGDGFADLLVGATGASDYDMLGELRLYEGGALPAELVRDDAAAVIEASDPLSVTGRTMVAAELTGDGATDLAVDEGSFDDFRGRVVLLSGPLLNGPASYDDAVTVLEGEATFSSTGTRMDAGDVDDDGQPDLVVAAHTLDTEVGDRAGRVYVFFGPVAPGTRSVAEADLILDAETDFAFFGMSVAVLDHDGDGVQDLAVGAPSDPFFGPPRPGIVYVFRGPLDSGRLTGADAALVYADDHVSSDIGFSMAGCDLNGDGRDALVLGAPHTDYPNEPDAGRVVVVGGRALEDGRRR